MKFKIGDVISDGNTQQYVIVSLVYKDPDCTEIAGYGCVDALAGREGRRAILLEDTPGVACESAFELSTDTPVVYDEYVDEYHLPNEWKFSEYEKRIMDL